MTTGEFEEGGLPQGVPEAARGLARLAGFDGGAGRSLFVPDGDGAVVLVGLGATADTRSLRRAAASAVELVKDGAEWSFVAPADCGAAELRAIAEGLCLGGYRFRISEREPDPPPGPCTLVSAADGAAAVLARARATCEGMLLTRDLVNAPAIDLGPSELSDAACEVAARHGMTSTVFRGDELLERGFRLVEAVGRGSSRSATVTVIESGLAGGKRPAVALIGKGVVFDSGGLGIKPGEAMALMRKDMGGAGTVIGAVDALGRMGCDVPFVAVVPAAENAIGPDSFRPGDIIRSYSGKTVEIGHTDAEGRLLLADAIAYVLEREPEHVVDVATLTGAARVALGPEVPALFGNDDELVARLLAASEANDEPLWRLPLVDAYEETIDSPWADVNNSASDRRGGAITAALFLRRWVGEASWAHVDLYAWEDKGKPGFPRGANGMSVRTLVDVVAGLS